ncbi:hypothetical protein SMICM304S_03618 [Streptomyces microflavus]
MAWRAGVLGRYAAAGGALFLLSDALIATGIAESARLPVPDFWVMSTYIAAQFLLALGVLTAGARGTTVRTGAYRGAGYQHLRPARTSPHARHRDPRSATDIRVEEVPDPAIRQPTDAGGAGPQGLHLRQ